MQLLQQLQSCRHQLCPAEVNKCSSPASSNAKVVPGILQEYQRHLPSMRQHSATTCKMGDTITDLYGFNIKVTELQKAERLACDGSAAMVQPSWMACIEKEQLPSESKLKAMIRQGVPPTCRPWVWMHTSPASRKKSAMANNYYQIMATAGATSPFMSEIEQDIAHTFPGHPWIQSPDGQAALKRVLSAYSVHNDKVGYCRAMNNIVGLLLVAMNRNEENAFWLLASLVEDILYPGTYSRKLEGCQVEMKALEELMSNKLPKLHAHLQATECDISLIATDWYLCLFCTSLPAETTARVWDALFNEGPKVLFRVALALFKLNEEYLLSCNNAGDIVMAMRAAATHMHNHDRLMSIAFDGIGSLPMATIDKFRDLKAREVEAAVRGSTGGAGAVASPQDGEEGRLSRRITNEELAQKAKAGFGKFMSGLNSWADKTADKLAKAAEKMGITDDEPGAAGRPAGGMHGGAFNTPYPSGVLNPPAGSRGPLAGPLATPPPSGVLSGPLATPPPSGVLQPPGSSVPHHHPGMTGLQGPMATPPPSGVLHPPSSSLQGQGGYATLQGPLATPPPSGVLSPPS